MPRLISSVTPENPIWSGFVISNTVPSTPTTAAISSVPYRTFTGITVVWNPYSQQVGKKPTICSPFYATGMPYSPNSRRKTGYCATLPTPAKALPPSASICICAGWSAATRAASTLGCGKKFPHPPCSFRSICTPAMSAGSWDCSPAIKTIAGRYRNSRNASGNSIPPTRSDTISPCSA